MASQRDVRNRIASVKNIQKITRAMEMVAAARLRRAEQRIAALRPYADAIGRVTRRAAQAAGAEAARVPLLREHESETHGGLLLVTGDRGLGGRFQLPGDSRRPAHVHGDGRGGVQSSWYATGRRGVSSLLFRGLELKGSYTGFADRPAYADARTIADELIRAYIDGEVDRVEMVFNSYVSPLTQHVTHQRLLHSPTRQSQIRSRSRAPQNSGRRWTMSPNPRRSSGGLSRLHRDLDLSCARRVGGRLLRRPDDGDAKRLRKRRRHHHRLHAADQPRAPGGDHPGDHGGGRRR